MSDQSTRVLLFRHGQTVSNQVHRIQGHLDSPLSELGVRQAKALGSHLKRYNIDALYTSSLGRARQTAQIVADFNGLVPVSEDRLKEVCFGESEGKTWAEIELHFPEMAAKWHRHEKHAVFPGGETRESVADRVMNLLQEWTSSHSKQTVAACTHGGVLACVAAKILGIPAGIRPMLDMTNTAIHELSYSEGKWKIVGWSEKEHLYDLSS